MRPEDGSGGSGGPDGGRDALLDADLLPLDAELFGAGAYARRAHAGTTQPTTTFTRVLRGRLLADMARPTAHSTATGDSPDGLASRERQPPD